MAVASEERPVGNFYDKYSSKNPIERALMNGFLRAVTELHDRVRPASVLEVGCGEGLLAQHLVARRRRGAGRAPQRFVACDVELSAIAPGLDASIELRAASIYDLPFEAGSFDLVVCCEVLEHLEDPRRGMSEIARVTRRSVIVSTPREPLWRVLNLARGKYISRFGNTPGHIQHFSVRTLEALVDREVNVVERRSPVPWTVLLGERRG